MIRIAILDDYQNCARTLADWSRIESRAEVVTFTRAFADPESVVSALREFDVLCVMRERTPLPRTVLEQLPKLKHVVLTGRRSQTLDIPYLGERGIGIDYTGAGPAAHATPEITIGLMLALARQIPTGDRLMKSGEWLENAPLGVVLHGKVLGIIGLGKVGTRVAEIATTLGMRVIAWSPNLTEERAAAAEVGFRSSKQSLLREADFVSLHLVLSPSTVNTLAAADLALLKRSAFVINAARGPLIDEGALIEALQSRRIAGAGLDVYDIEPLPKDHALRNLSNCILLPHFGYVTQEVYEAFYRETVAAVEKYIDRPGP